MFTITDHSIKTRLRNTSKGDINYNLDALLRNGRKKQAVNRLEVLKKQAEKAKLSARNASMKELNCIQAVRQAKQKFLIVRAKIDMQGLPLSERFAAVCQAKKIIKDAKQLARKAEKDTVKKEARSLRISAALRNLEYATACRESRALTEQRRSCKMKLEKARENLLLLSDQYRKVADLQLMAKNIMDDSSKVMEGDNLQSDKARQDKNVFLYFQRKAAAAQKEYRDARKFYLELKQAYPREFRCNTANIVDVHDDDDASSASASSAAASSAAASIAVKQERD